MREILFVLVFLILICLLIPMSASPEGKFLGRLGGSRYDPESTNNPYGKYGSRYSPDSINNPYGEFGSIYSDKSPNNPYATDPPAIFSDGEVWGWED